VVLELDILPELVDPALHFALDLLKVRSDRLLVFTVFAAPCLDTD
jgi:hypothetical protein